MLRICACGLDGGAEAEQDRVEVIMVVVERCINGPESSPQHRERQAQSGCPLGGERQPPSNSCRGCRKRLYPTGAACDCCSDPTNRTRVPQVERTTVTARQHRSAAGGRCHSSTRFDCIRLAACSLGCCWNGGQCVIQPVRRAQQEADLDSHSKRKHLPKGLQLHI